ncbi:MAG TPA: sigma 54-interacting transcriptional regulator [Polyangia bacterium]|jgi:DNA-binding NtrC family response regulator|nr:sigma 54-interacting transcriptional regulator [Polyangia bacterium]
MKRVLCAWVSHSDLAAADGEEGQGPIAAALAARPCDEVVLLSSHGEERTAAYAAWLGRCTDASPRTRIEPLSGPTEYREIHRAASTAVLDVLGRHPRAGLVFHLSAGTAAMAAVWIILAKTRFPAELIESSREHGVRTAEVPFELSAELLPELLRGPDAALARRSMEPPIEAPEFQALVHRSPVMRRLLERARRVALRSVPVLIEGESGTGKELLARALHHASPRHHKPFVVVNCGAIPESLVEAELFGHERGAFTGATAARLGHFREAHGGTLFLDEIGELPLGVQVKLLRALQEGEVVAVGATHPVPVDVRVIAATHRNLLQEVAAQRFRGDLFYRLAVAVLIMPPLRERPGDAGLLIDRALEQINRENAGDPGYQPHRLAPAARSLLLAHSWPGNVRELFNTLRRAALWSSGPTIGADDVREAILPAAAPAGADTILGRPLGEGLDLPELLAEVARHYLTRALKEGQGNKSRAAALLGLPSHQTLGNWLRRYGSS